MVVPPVAKPAAQPSHISCMVLRLLSASTAQSVASQSTPFADIPILSAAVPRKSATRVAVLSADLKPTRLDAPGSAEPLSRSAPHCCLTETPAGPLALGGSCGPWAVRAGGLESPSTRGRGPAMVGCVKQRQRPAPTGTVPSIPSARPRELGFAADLGDRIGAAVQGFVDRRRLAGAVVVVARRGVLAHLEARGWPISGQARRCARIPSSASTR